MPLLVVKHGILKLQLLLLLLVPLLLPLLLLLLLLLLAQTIRNGILNCCSITHWAGSTCRLGCLVQERGGQRIPSRRRGGVSGAPPSDFSLDRRRCRWQLELDQLGALVMHGTQAGAPVSLTVMDYDSVGHHAAAFRTRQKSDRRCVGLGGAARDIQEVPRSIVGWGRDVVGGQGGGR